MYLYYTLSSTGGDSGSTAAWVDNRMERHRAYSENGHRAYNASDLIYLPNS
ncbi:MAG: hypothetical protein NZ550_01440 [Fimbriimonadales bacterium]|nr:hypothetical protein [Fimbriimonadales bacterium]MDW8052105.1 hypothetical protein [Armatimonadota bacterium]